jgi:hypothetical protein
MSGSAGRTGAGRRRYGAHVPTFPDTDLKRIQVWARERVPEHLWDQLKVEADVSERHVDIVEVRPRWDGLGEHTRFPIARLRYTKSTGLWAIYWRDQNLKFHEYVRKRPTKNIQALLDYIQDSGDPIFWG